MKNLTEAQINILLMEYTMEEIMIMDEFEALQIIQDIEDEIETGKIEAFYETNY